jgi:prefoldin beta subunit
MERLPPQVQQQLVQFQQVQQQAQAIASQRVQMELQLKEIVRAASELEKLEGDVPTYKSIGSILIRSEREKLLEELKEKKETLEVRIKGFQRQEEKIQGRLKEMQEKIQQALKAGGGGAPQAG